MRDLFNCATVRVGHDDVSAQMFIAFVNDDGADCVQRLML